MDKYKRYLINSRKKIFDFKSAIEAITKKDELNKEAISNISILASSIPKEFKEILIEIQFYSPLTKAIETQNISPIENWRLFVNGGYKTTAKFSITPVNTHMISTVCDSSMGEIDAKILEHERDKPSSKDKIAKTVKGKRFIAVLGFLLASITSIITGVVVNILS